MGRVPPTPAFPKGKERRGGDPTFAPRFTEAKIKAVAITQYKRLSALPRRTIHKTRILYNCRSAKKAGFALFAFSADRRLRLNYQLREFSFSAHRSWEKEISLPYKMEVFCAVRGAANPDLLRAHVVRSVVLLSCKAIIVHLA